MTFRVYQKYLLYFTKPVVYREKVMLKRAIVCFIRKYDEMETKYD
jgi:hypothetical protein